MRITGSRLTPCLSSITGHHYAARPPQLCALQAADGTVTIAPRRHDFRWKDHGLNASDNLNAGYAIHYTLDGSAPDGQSSLYTGPIVVDGGLLKAVAIINGESGAQLQEQMGYAKARCTVKASTCEEGHPAAMAADANGSTFWLSRPEALPSLVVDLGEARPVSGFAYTPPAGFSQGMMAKGNLMVSDNGRVWTTVGSYEFGNLINDPSKRYLFLASPVMARFVKIDATERTAGARQAAAAEIDIF